MLAVLDKPAIKERAHPITVDSYHKMITAGVLGKDDRVELLGGLLVEKMPKSEIHVYLTEKLAAWLRSILPDGLKVMEEKPLTLRDSEPEPDIAVVRAAPRDVLKGHPTTAEFVIEVALTTLATDHDKADIYAAAKIAQYLIVDANTKVAWLYEKPANGQYQSRAQITENVKLVADGHECVLHLRNFCDWD